MRRYQQAHPRSPASLGARVAQAFQARAMQPHVGLELELFPLDAATGAPVALDRVRAALGPLASEVTFEPGGQVELSPACRASVAALLQDTGTQLTRVTDACATAGIELAAAGMHPTAGTEEVGLQRPTARYSAMQDHFDRIGPAGRQMMRTTASLQVCVDLLPGLVDRQWNVAVAVAPVLAALSAYGADPGGRARIWRAVEPGRVAWDGRLIGRPEATYCAFAAGAARIPPSPDGTRSAVDHHLSTLFPPVRPRGYLEVRVMDARPWPEAQALVVLVAALLGDDRSLADLFEVVGVDRDATDDRWKRVTADGLADLGLRADADAVLAVAASALDRPSRLGLPDDADALLERLQPASVLGAV